MRDEGVFSVRKLETMLEINAQDAVNLVQEMLTNIDGFYIYGKMFGPEDVSAMLGPGDMSVDTTSERTNLITAAQRLREFLSTPRVKLFMMSRDALEVSDEAPIVESFRWLIRQLFSYTFVYLVKSHENVSSETREQEENTRAHRAALLKVAKMVVDSLSIEMVRLFEKRHWLFQMSASQRDEPRHIIHDVRDPNYVTPLAAFRHRV
jgi:hypothetical protein